MPKDSDKKVTIYVVHTGEDEDDENYENEEEEDSDDDGVLIKRDYKTRGKTKIPPKPIKKIDKIPLSKRFHINRGLPITNLKSLIDAFDHPKADNKQKELVNSLRDLDLMIGMEKFKEQIINQILFFVQDMQDSQTFLHTVITGPPGTGKCHGFGSKIMIYTGEFKEVQDIKVGDQLMGDDSTPRKVLSTCKGKEPMYIIKQSNADDYIVNESHILSLSCTDNENNGINVYEKRDKYKKRDIVDISVRDYLTLSNNAKCTLKGYKVPINFPKKDIPIDPYIIGLWLADGLNKETKEINGITNELRNLNLINNKHIPAIYKYNAQEIQLKLLAGIIDTDGTYNKINHCYDLIQKNYTLAKDIEFIARCLGFSSKVVECQKSCQTGTYYKQCISGNDIEEIPCLISHKKAQPRKHIKNNLYTEITVEPVNENYYKQGPEYEYYYGFELDGNHRFVLGDHTVTHNTMAVNILAKIYCKLGILETDKVVKADRSSLVGKWLGSTAIKTKEVLDSAKGGVLVLDEVYSLGNKEHSDTFSKECIDTINQYLSEHVNDFVCVIAGYKDLVQECFFSANPGLERRFPWKFTIDPYTHDELTKILKIQLNLCGWKFDDSVSDKYLSDIIKINKDQFTGNGGDTKNLIDKCKIVNARRVFTENTMLLDDTPIKKRRRGRKFYTPPSADINNGKVLSKDDLNNGLKSFLDSKKDIKTELPDSVKMMWA